MNALELADLLETTESTNNQAAAMLRQQQAEIAELKAMLGHYEDVYEGVVTHPAELTDEEIYQTWVEAKNTALNTRGSDFVEVIFARAILRKAEEK